MWSPFFVQTHFQQFSREGKTKGGIPFDTWQVLHKEDLGNFSRRGKQHDRAGSQGGQLAGLVVSFWGETMVSPRNFVDSVFRWVLQGAWQLESFVGVYISSKQILQKTTDKSWFTCFFFSVPACVLCLNVCLCVCFLRLDSILGIYGTQKLAEFRGSKLMVACQSHIIRNHSVSRRQIPGGGFLSGRVAKLNLADLIGIIQHGFLR